MRAVVLRPQPNPGDPLIDEPRVLARAHVPGVIDPARKGKVVERFAMAFKPGQDAAPCSVKQLKLNRAARLLLDDNGAIANPAAHDEIADLDLHDVAAAKLAVDGQIEHGPVTEPALSIKPKTNGPDLLRLEGSLRAELSTGVPRALTFDVRIEF